MCARSGSPIDLTSQERLQLQRHSELLNITSPTNPLMDTGDVVEVPATSPPNVGATPAGDRPTIPPLPLGKLQAPPPLCGAFPLYFIPMWGAGGLVPPGGGAGPFSPRSLSVLCLWLLCRGRVPCPAPAALPLFPPLLFFLFACTQMTWRHRTRCPPCPPRP